MGERFNTRASVVTHALARALWRKAGAGPVRRVLVAHNLLLGDTLMLTPLIAKLRAVHPAAEVDLLASPAFAPLYAGRPYGVRALPFTPSRSATTRELLGRGPYDLAFVVGDNRYSWLAAALGARHIVAHAGGPARSNWFVDEAHPYDVDPAAWGDMVAELLEGEDPAPYARGAWPDPPAAPFEPPTGPYAVLHVRSAGTRSHARSSPKACRSRGAPGAAKRRSSRHATRRANSCPTPGSSTSHSSGACCAGRRCWSRPTPAWPISGA
jgi:hypothetical protein